MSTILFFGDSLTAGFGLTDPAKQSYPSLIGAKISAAGLQYEIINAGLSGDTSGNGLTRLDYWLSRTIDVFVLELGINDIRHGVPPRTIHKNLHAILFRVRRKYPTARLIIMGMQIPVNIAFAPAAAFGQIFHRLAAEFNASLVPFFLKDVMGIRHLNLVDGLHPSAAGYEVIAGNVWPVIRAVL